MSSWVIKRSGKPSNFSRKPTITSPGWVFCRDPRFPATGGDRADGLQRRGLPASRVGRHGEQDAPDVAAALREDAVEGGEVHVPLEGVLGLGVEGLGDGDVDVVDC